VAGDTQEYWLHALVATATADSGEQVRILPDPIDPESLGDKSRAIGKSVRAISGNRRGSRRDGNFV